MDFDKELRWVIFRWKTDILLKILFYIITTINQPKKNPLHKNQKNVALIQFLKEKSGKIRDSINFSILKNVVK